MTDLIIRAHDFQRKVKPGDSVTLWAPAVRDDTGGGVIFPRAETIPLDSDGETVTNVAPGPLELLFRYAGGQATMPINVTVPDQETVTLAELLAGDYTYSPPVVSELRSLVAQAKELGHADDAEVETLRSQVAALTTRLEELSVPAAKDDAEVETLRSQVAALTTRLEELSEQEPTPVTIDDVAGLAARLSSVETKASKPVTIDDVTGLVAALAGKATLEHTHAVADVTGLVAALAGKATLEHTHTVADITGLTARLDALQAELDELKATPPAPEEETPEPVSYSFRVVADDKPVPAVEDVARLSLDQAATLKYADSKLSGDARGVLLRAEPVVSLTGATSVGDVWNDAGVSSVLKNITHAQGSHLEENKATVDKIAAEITEKGVLDV